LHVFSADGVFSSPDKVWLFKDDNDDRVAIQDFLEKTPDATAWIVRICNTFGYPLPSKGKPAVYPITVFNNYDEATFRTRYHGDEPIDQQEKFKMVSGFLDGVREFHEQRLSGFSHIGFLNIPFSERDYKEIKAAAREILLP
jgi:hypothetical protein